ncbi:hypothetical protein JYQ62_22800 [Nostoc sp. UHCC 0702]|nr:hypothetical protein JYQ62_22800 [Nostoc sp. UHCC 0702]
MRVLLPSSILNFLQQRSLPQKPFQPQQFRGALKNAVALGECARIATVF